MYLLTIHFGSNLFLGQLLLCVNYYCVSKITDVLMSLILAAIKEREFYKFTTGAVHSHGKIRLIVIVRCASY